MPARFYITTAIDYVNGRPHLGHAYEKVLADVLARVHRQRGDATYFLTGTDEHGQKILKAAAEAGLEPQVFVDQIAATFRDAWKLLGISYDKFIRTSDQRHTVAVQELFRRLHDARSPKSGEPVLFQQHYEGLYCEGCESFKQEKDLVDGKCPEHHTVPKRVRETNFFFRLSEYDEALLRHIEAHPEFIQPDYRRNEVVNVIREGLQDISVSRPNIPWGIPLPDDIPGSEGHTAYVWPDALLNYLSAIGWPDRVYSKWWLAREGETGGAGAARQDEFQDLDGAGRPGAAWAGTAQPQFTNALHLIGKDISRFHCVLWPALLLAAGVPLPRQVYVHGFIYARGERLSKSLGNVVDPVELAQEFGADALRFYLTAAIPTGRDGEFTLDQFIELVNVRLANELGNLASRSLTMVHKYFGGQSPAAWSPESLQDAEARAALDQLIGSAENAAIETPKAYQELRLHDAVAAAWQPVARANEFIERFKPWAVAKDESRREELGTALAALLETLRLAALWSWPIVPAKSEELWSLLRLPALPGETRGEDAAPRFRAAPERALAETRILFPRIESGSRVRAPAE
ncbi:MAG TPA: class I tRNA ligase family protein [Candidatus Udaeobacter sp.]|nr:class I tRNA ligase family protein [Candidatus Udaeobacter sp.]